MPATKKKDDLPKNYKEAMEELETIVEEIDQRDVDIDLLSEKVKRAHVLIDFCQKRVEAVRFEIENVLTPKD